MRELLVILLVFVWQDVFSQNNLLLITQNVKGNISLSSYDSLLSKKINELEIDLSEYDGEIAGNGIQSKCSSIQANSDLTKFYFIMYSADYEEDKIFWTKLLEFDVANNSLKEVFNLNEIGLGYWYYSDVLKSIVIETANNQFSIIDIKSSEIKNIYQGDLSNVHIKDDDANILIFGHKGKDIIKVTINSENWQANEDVLGSTFVYSHINNTSSLADKAVCLGKSGMGTANPIRTIRLFQNGERKEKEFEYWLQTSFWVSDRTFLVVDENSIKRFDLDLNVVEEITIPYPIIENTMQNSLTIRVANISTSKANKYYIIPNDLSTFHQILIIHSEFLIYH